MIKQIHIGELNKLWEKNTTSKEKKNEEIQFSSEPNKINLMQ